MANFVPRDGTQSNLGRTDKPWGTAWINVLHGTADASVWAGTAGRADSLGGTSAAGFVSRKVSDDTKEPTGFVDRTTSTLAFNNTSRAFTISGTHSIYSHGTLYACSAGTLTVSATPGFNFLFYGTTGALSQVQGFPGFDQALVASVYYNGTKGLLADERHGIIMDSATHEYLHDTVRCRYESGLAGTFGDSSFTLSAGTITDEDLDVGLPQQGTCQVMYRRAGVWDWTTPQGSYYYASGGNVYYDNAGTIAAATSNRFVAYWIFATTDVGCPIVSLMGQREDTTIANARANNTPDALSLTSLPYNEMKLLYRVILKNDATPYEEVADYRNVSSLPVSNYVATDHLTLSNIGKYKHTEIDAFIDGTDLVYAGSALTLPSSNLAASGLITAQRVGEAVGFGNVLFMGSDGAYYKSSADGTATMPAIAMALGTYGSASSCKMLHYGWVRNDAWAFVCGKFAYASQTSGSLMGTTPSGTGDQVQALGVAYGTGLLFFNPSLVLAEVK